MDLGEPLEPAALGLALSGEPLPVFAEAPRDPMGPSPLRRAASVRRTMTLDAIWPEGKDGPVLFTGDACDMATEGRGETPTILAEAHVEVSTHQRVILDVVADPPRPELSRLRGARAGGHLRQVVDEALPAERAAGAPLYLLLDDLAGATLVCSWAWSVWGEGWTLSASEEQREQRAQQMQNVCIGFRPGSDALSNMRFAQPEQNRTRVAPLPHPEDIGGWHELTDRAPKNFRRARRLDIWRVGDLVHVDAAFQDSASALDGGLRVAVHEYRLYATAELCTGTLCALDIRPGTLPYKECGAAPVNARALLGARLGDLRELVLQRLRKSAGCTHLNDVLRALADVPALAARLPVPKT